MSLGLHPRPEGLHRGGDRRHRLDSGCDGRRLILGFAESYTAGYWPGSAGTRWTDLVIFAILITFMIFRPQGLFGRADIKKV